jgi:hypothetical protein
MKITDHFQMASDYDGDLHLFPRNLEEQNYIMRWKVWIIDQHGQAKPAPAYDPIMGVKDGRVTNPLGPDGNRSVNGWWVDSVGAQAIELQIDDQAPIRFVHPRAAFYRQADGDPPARQ